MGNVRVRWTGALVFVLAIGALCAVAEQPAPVESKEATPTPTAAGDSADGRVKGYVPPPSQLKLVGEHWTPYDPPAPPEGAQVHTVAQGDCLWNLARQYYNDPYLWPTIWDANRWVTFSHWIYPGDPLVIPPNPNVVAETEPAAPEPEPVVEAPRPPIRMEDAKPALAAPVAAVPKGPLLVPAAEGQEIACAAQLHERFDPSPLTISGREVPDKELQGQGDIVYMSAGQDMQIEPGTQWVVVRPGPVVKNPETGKPQAVYVHRLGRLRVVAVQPHSATAELTLSCDAVMQGDFLVPYRETPVPMIERIPLQRLSTPEPTGHTGLVIVAADPKADMAGTGEIVGIDLGAGSGITAGDRVLFWRPQKTGSLPRKVLAQGVVLTTNGGGSMVKILEATEEVLPGDRIEIL